MSFQWIINKAAAISLNRKPVVASTQSRSGIVRTVSRGAATWKIEVSLPEGLPWTEVRNDLAKAETLDRYTSSWIQLYTYELNRYQGNSVNSTGFVATINKGSNVINLTTSPSTPTGGFKFRAGDIIQLGYEGHCYAVAEDVPYNAGSVTLHRPVLETSQANINLYVGTSARFNVVCRQFPNWTITQRNIVSWDGPFVFYEVI